eukprot:s40_g25.t1
MESRQADQVHLLLCDAVFQFQMWRSPRSHAHLEQPDGSHMLYQEELAAILEQAKIAKCDMCTAGQLKHPETGRHLQKRTQIVTTSNIMHQYISQQTCQHDHIHDVVAGSCRHPTLGRVNVSQFTELYTKVFAKRVARCFQCISQIREKSRSSDEPALVSHIPDDLQNPQAKRQKLNGKQPPSGFYQQMQIETERNSFIQRVAAQAPRVGKRLFTEGSLIQMAEDLFPQLSVKAIEACKGADRCRPPPIGISKTTAPLRLTMGVHRHQQGNFFDDAWEDWTKLTRKSLLRKSPPAKVLITLFAHPYHSTSTIEPLPESKQSQPQPMEPETKRICIRNPDTATELSKSLEPGPTGKDSSMFPQERSEWESAEQKGEELQSHGPKFRRLTAEQKQQLKRMHANLGHPDAQLLGNVLRDQGWSSEAIEGIKDMHCPACFENQRPKISRPSHLSEPKAFNELVSIDAVQWTSEQGMQFTFYHMIDAGTNFQVAFTCDQGSSKEVSAKMITHWFSWAGPPKTLMSDSAGEFCSDEFGVFLQSHDVRSIIIPAEAHWQLGKCERHGAILQDMLNKAQKDFPISSQEDLERMLVQCTAAKNSLSRYRGYSPEILVLGKSRHVPGSVCQEDPQPSDFMLDDDMSWSQNNEIAQFQENLKMRETARVAFIRSDHDMKLRRSFLRRSRPPRCAAQIGQWVMFWRNGKGAAPGAWHGPAKIIMREAENVVWISHMSRLYRCAPEHLRELSSREHENLPSRNDSEPFPSPAVPRLGTGVFQYHDLSQQPGNPNFNPPDNPSSNNHDSTSNDNSEDNNPNPIPNVSMPQNPNVSEAPESVQPDAEPDAAPSNAGPASVQEFENAQPWEIPVPPSEEGEFSDAAMVAHDEWLIRDNLLIRVHRRPRLKLFCPSNIEHCPVPRDWLKPERYNVVKSQHGSEWSFHDTWRNNIQAHQCMPSLWTGETQFTIIPEHVHDKLQDQLTNLCTDTFIHGQELALTLSTDDVETCMHKSPSEQIAFLASAAKRQRAEVKEKSLSAADLRLFNEAKTKEISSWLSTESVRKIARNQIPEEQILRSRWVLTWKPVEPTTSNPNPDAKPKARLVILGYGDPQLEQLARDSPTMGKDSRTLILQYAASTRQKIKSFDIQTAFLRGSRRDGRILGMYPPPEMRSHMRLQPWECCELLKSAYGLVNAPLLWYEELRTALLNLQFVVSPLDPCVFVLPRANGQGIHGIVGVHVDDGLSAGDKTFEAAISQLEAKYPFGSKKESDFIFTGIHVSQQWDGTIVLDQTQYIEDIPSIDIDRQRRQQPGQPVTEHERQALRGLVGSIQYAATNARPDLSAKLSLLQAKINQATIQDLHDANKLLHEAKLHKHTNITIQSIPLENLRFVSFSDASFANRANAQSQKGCLILAASKQIGEWQSSLVSPLLWYSRKIARVVGSTLASETYALSGAVDLLSWLRIHWDWICQPSSRWKEPETCLSKAPEAYAVVDCKSLYDLIQKTTIPQCQEHRVMLEALIIKDRLREGVTEFQKFGTPLWQWPPYRDSTLSHGSLQRGATSMNVWSEKQARVEHNVVPAQALMELFLAEEGDIHKRIFGNRLLKTFHAIREILLAGDTNRLVAELTFVRINDLAAPPEPMHPLVLIEPFVAFLIVLNGIMIGFQTDPKYGEWEGWPYFEIGFACFLVLEIMTRMHLLGCDGFWCGPEQMWNYFDLFLAGTGLVDIIVQQASNEKTSIFGTSLLRFCRLIRLVRIVKIFRLKAMRDLRLMVKGLIAGIKTLVLAFTLLFSVLYVISGFATMTLGSYEETVALGLMIYFQSLPDSMFTAFRCFTGECVNEAGEPLTHILAREYGLVFILSYVMSYMLVTMGIFNVILAVYVDITMKAAKENEAQTAEQHARESIRIARTTRELLKKFAAAYHLYQDLEENGSSNMEQFEIRASAALFTDDELQENIEITKELFLLVIQDRDVQLLMDDLDLPPDRANLFEIIDADSSGTLHIAELVHGLLKIRGEVNKSDTIATLLATKAVQNMLTETKFQVLNNLDDLKTELLGLIFEQQVKLRKAIAAAASSPETPSSVSDAPRRGRSGGRSGSPGVSRSNTDNSRDGRKVMSPSMPLGRMKAPLKPEVAEDSDAVPIPPEE